MVKCLTIGTRACLILECVLNVSYSISVGITYKSTPNNRSLLLVDLPLESYISCLGKGFSCLTSVWFNLYILGIKLI